MDNESPLTPPAPIISLRDHRHPVRKGFRLVRRLSLMAVLLGTFLLVRYNHQADPRFYYAVDTPAGRWMASRINPKLLMYRPAVRSPPPEQWSTEEQRLRDHLTEQLRENWPTHQVRLITGRELNGKVQRREADGILFEELYGAQGRLALQIPHDQIQVLVPYPHPAPEITRRDVAFARELPAFTLYKHPPFTVLTDEPFFHARRAVRELETLHRTFVDLFSPLIRNRARGQDIQILIFSDESGFRDYQRRFAPGAEHAGGFYSTVSDRLVLFNYEGTEELRETRQVVDAQFAPERWHHAQPQVREALEREQRRMHRKIDQLAARLSLRTLRHEGAHQLLFTYGVHSRHFAENTWLMEGLASYLETDPPGLPDWDRLELLRDAGRAGGLWRWQDLLDYRDTHGFLARVEENAEPHADPASMAYAQSWFMVRHLMAPVNRAAFFDYMRAIRDPANLWTAATRSRHQWFAQLMGWKPETCDARFQEALDQALRDAAGSWPR